MELQTIDRGQAARFLLKKHGLLGATSFAGAEGVLHYIGQTGCVQFDPVDVCGKSHELALFARVKGFTKPMLSQLLYERRALIDYWDKNMSLLRVEDWPMLGRTRDAYRAQSRSHEAVDAVAPEIKRYLREKGCATSQELPLTGRADWYWSETTLSRAALETLYFRGELVVHHKTRTVKSYALTEDCLPEALLSAPNPCAELADMQAWQALRRIGAVGLMRNGPSDAWLCIESFGAEARDRTFQRLESEGKIVPVRVETLAKPFYLRAEDQALLEGCQKPFAGARRARFLPPLDCMLWDRKLIRALFDFDYTWEVYTPVAKRKYGHYTLPVLDGERFAGRAELVCDRKDGLLRARRFWPEKGLRMSDAFRRALWAEAERLCRFHELRDVCAEPDWPMVT